MPDTIAETLSIYRFVVRSRQESDPRSAGYLADAHALGLTGLSRLECQDLYFIEGQVTEAGLQRLADELLSDPITQGVQWSQYGYTQPVFLKTQPGVEVALRPGVTDPVAEQIVRAARVLGIQGVERASTGLRFVVDGEKINPELLHLLAQRLLANPVVQRYAFGEIEPVFPHPAETNGQVETIPVIELNPDALLAVSRQRRAALDLAEMFAIQSYFSEDGREPTDVELETIAQTWSEHCIHKTFKAQIELSSGQPGKPASAYINKEKEPIQGLLRTYIRAATELIAVPWVRSAFQDNAGIIEFDDQFEVSFKVETHNHPSAIEPFGGANTGTGGVIRDVLGVSARPIAATDVLCFGPQDLPLSSLPEGVLHPRRIQSGVVAGVQDYGNKIGIPTVNGAILYDPGFTANPLVFCGCVGIAPRDSHPHNPQPGDRVIILGGRTGRDGLRGATFSSQTMDAQTGQVAGASVQIGDPITEKGLIEVVVRARDAKLYTAITDCGAGGLSSAIGELSSQCGADVELMHVRLKYPGLAPWEIWLSEAQERMVLAVPPANLPALQAICDTFEVEMTNVGVFTGNNRLVVRYQDQVVLKLDNAFLHEGIPQRMLDAILPPPSRPAMDTPVPGLEIPNPTATLLALLAHPNIASKAPVIRIYDHEVQGGTVVKPLTGVYNDGPSDACVLKPAGASGSRGLVLSTGINPEYGKLDAYRMAASVIDEAIRNAVAVGADPSRIALLDNFCWGDPLRPETLGSLVQAARGCYDAALHFGTPFISGKDSLNNEYLGSDGFRHAIPPTLLISAIGLIENIDAAVTMDLKEPGNSLYLVGEHQPVFGGSHFNLVQPALALPDEPVPTVSASTPAVYPALHQAMRLGLVRSCHDLSEGGLAVAAAEMCIGGRLGARLDLPAGESLRTLFGETNGCLVVEVRPKDGPAFKELFEPGLVATLGLVNASAELNVAAGSSSILSLPVSSLVEAWNRQP